MEAWTLAVAINCAQPRIPFREFYGKVYGITYPAQHGEVVSDVMKRIADSIASYSDYAEAYRDQCK